MIDGAGTNHFVTLVMFMNYLIEIIFGILTTNQSSIQCIYIQITYLCKFVDKNNYWDNHRCKLDHDEKNSQGDFEWMGKDLKTMECFSPACCHIIRAAT